MVSKTLQAMLDALPPSFNKDPVPGLAIVASSAKERLRMSVSGNRLSVYTGEGFTPDFEVDLSEGTVQNVAEAIDGHEGFSAYLHDFGDKPALRLVDVELDAGGKLFVFQNPLYAILKAFSIELAALKASAREMTRQLTLMGANGRIQDFLGGFFGIRRIPMETDDEYGQRVIETVKTPKCNNRALEHLIKKIAGVDTRVVDLGRSTLDSLLMNDPSTPIQDTDYPLYQEGPFAGEPCTFGIVLLHKRKGGLTLREYAGIRETALSFREAGTRPRLIWQGDGQYMLMNDSTTPMQDTNYPLWDYSIYADGYLSEYFSYE